MYSKTTKIIGVICAISVVVVLFVFVFRDELNDDTIIIGVESGNFASLGVAYILEDLLEENYEVNVEIKEQGGIGFDRITNEELFSDMDVNLVHINPMVSIKGNEDIISLYVDDTQTVAASPRSIRNSKGLCISRDVSSLHGITHIRDLRYSDVFDIFKNEKVAQENVEAKEVDARGEILVKGEDKNNIIIEQIRAASYGYDDNFKISSRNEDLLFKEVDTYIEEGIPFIFQCEAPHYIWTKYDLVMLEESTHDPSFWEIVYPADSENWLSESRVVTAWQPNYFKMYYVRSLEGDYYEVARFLNRVNFGISDVSEILNALEIEDIDPEEYANEWILQNKELVNQWIE